MSGHRPNRAPSPGAIDESRESEIVIHPDGRVETVHAKGDVALRGAASDLLLALYRRVAIDDLDLVGDPALARELVERVNTE